MKRLTDMKEPSAEFDIAPPQAKNLSLSQTRIHSQMDNRPGDLSRMADFESWGCAIADAVGYGSVEFRRVYAASRRRLTDESLSGHPVGACIVEFMKNREDYRGTPSELYGELDRVADHLAVQHDKRFPKAANVLTKRLKEVIGDLRDIGISVEIGKSDKRYISIHRSIDKTVQADQPSADCVN